VCVRCPLAQRTAAPTAQQQPAGKEGGGRSPRSPSPPGVSATILSASLLAPERLQREIVVIQREAVLEFFERQSRAAVPFEVGHLHLAGRPDPLHVLD